MYNIMERKASLKRKLDFGSVIVDLLAAVWRERGHGEDVMRRSSAYCAVGAIHRTRGSPACLLHK
jgi:hypothetical protein